MVDRILVSFEGEGAGVEDLAWGQKAIWRSIQRTGHAETIDGIAPVPPGTTLEDCATALRFGMNRFQSLRTRLRFEPDGRVRQELFSSGEVPMEIVDAGDADPAEAAEQLRLRYNATPFDYADEWPVRIGVIRKDGVFTHSVAVYLHLAFDAHGFTVLLADLAASDFGAKPLPPVTAVEPLEQARQQATPAVQRRGAAAIRHMEQVLRAASTHRFPPPAEPGESYYRRLRYNTPATGLAVRAIATAQRVDTSAVLLGSFALAVARLTGNNPVLAVLAVSNRFRSGFADSVSVLAQISPCLIDLADLTLGEVAGQARRAAMSAYKSAYYDPMLRVELQQRLAEERGEEIDLSCYFNDRREDIDPPTGPMPTAEQIRQAQALGVVRWDLDSEAIDEKLYFDVDDVPGGLEFTMSADTLYLPSAEMERLARTIEAVTVETALDPTAPTGFSAVPVSV
jgi:hypothetical protein